MSLKKYHKKRDFHNSPEPEGKLKKSGQKLIFVIQEHAASHLHWDFRLELDGVLKSWAVPKGPCEDPGVKRLAVHVEDHPLDYGDFEGRIPKGHYGAGTVRQWDKGYWEPLGDPHQQLKKGHIEFILKGKKLHGLWHLIRFKDQPKNWLLIKGKDEHAKEAIKSPMPKSVFPQLAVLSKTPPKGNGWLHEIKLDGYRLLSFIKSRSVKCFTRNQLDWSEKIPSIIAALKKLKLQNCILDGELVVFNENNISEMQLLQNAFGKKNVIMHYYVFDIIYYNGFDLGQTPLLQRKQLLSSLIKEDETSVIRISNHIIGNGQKVYEQCCQHGYEGIVSKKVESHYTQDRTKDWLKIKCIQSGDFVICGYTSPKNSRKYFGSLLLGHYEKNILKYCGHVGTGFTEKSLKQMFSLIKKLEIDEALFPKISKSILGDVHWVKPEIVVEVQYNNVTKDGILRHPSFKGIRYDKDDTSR